MEKTDNTEVRFETSYSDALEARSRGDYATAARSFRTALELAREFGDADERVYNSLVGLARCQYRLGERAQAEEHYRRALTIMEDHLKDEHPSRFASVLWELAILYTDQDRFQEAILFFRQAIKVTGLWAGPGDRFIADCLWGLSKCLCATGALAEAEESIRQAIAIYENTGEDVKDFLATNRNNLVTVLIEQHKFEEAITEIDMTLESESERQKSIETANVLCQKAWCLQRINKFDRAGAALKKALKIATDLEGGGGIRAALTRVALAHNYNCQGSDFARAEKLLLQAIKVLRKQDGEDLAADLGGAMFELALCYSRQKKTREAIDILEQLLAIHEKDPLANPELFADTLFHLAQCHEKNLDYRKARKYYRRSIDIREKLYGLLNEDLATAMIHLAKCLRRLDEQTDATMIQKQADQILAAIKARA
ncbi:MAG: tetratricopeptide repeat protein [Candidatus Melainabacteria bacterium]|nr:tetratricopeptide repeat protein [Candidatus Melainabacteria bacterium]